MICILVKYTPRVLKKRWVAVSRMFFEVYLYVLTLFDTDTGRDQSLSRVKSSIDQWNRCRTGTLKTDVKSNISGAGFAPGFSVWDSTLQMQFLMAECVIKRLLVRLGISPRTNIYPWVRYLTLILNRGNSLLDYMHGRWELHMGPKVISLGAHTSRARCAHHLREVRGLTHIVRESCA
jgi:hypothetical protein